MASTSKKRKEIKIEIEQEAKKLLDILAKKAGVRPTEVVEAMTKMWIKENLDLLTKAEKEKFKDLFI